jgi:hypothetical protein
MHRRFKKILSRAMAMTAAVGLAACVHTPPRSAAEKPTSEKIPAFSGGVPGRLPAGWEPFKLLRTKKSTEYDLIAGPGHTVLHAKAVKSSSALLHPLNIDPNKAPWLKWSWKTAALIETADNFHRATDDSPTRIILAFDGDKSRLSALDQVMFDMAKLITGREAPYATLMYIWENKAAVGTVVPNTRTGRIQSVVVESGAAGVGQWRRYSRNIVDDYRKAFNEDPGRLIGIGVLTDTDNTGETVEAWYGDIQLVDRP